MMKFKEYLEITYSAWLGKMIGIRLGAPVENWTAQEIKDTYGQLQGYPVDYGVFAADDDSNGPLFFVRALLEEMSEDISVETLGNNLLNYISDGHGFFWWGGKGISTEDTAYQNLKEGIKAPLSGSADTNGIALAEQIGGQIFSDCWGYVSYGKPELAAKLARKMSSVTHDGDGIHGGVFVAVCIALAYQYTDCIRVMEEALSYIPSGSGYAKVVKDILSIYDSGVSQEECLQYIQKTYGYDQYPGVCHIIPNTAIMIMAMAYGENDFSKTLLMLCEAGWDTDCTCGNVGSIMGALVGIEGIDDHWIKPINDLVLCSCGDGYLNQSTVSTTALLFSVIGAKLNQVEIDEKYQTIFEDKKKETYFFDLPHSTQAFVCKSNRYSEMNLVNEKGTLKCVINQGFPGYTGIVYKKTYFRPEDVYDCRYQPSFTPTLYAGEKIRFRLSNPNKLDVSFQIYCKDRNENEYLGEVFKVGIDTEEHTYVVSGPKEATYSEFGLKIHFHTRIIHNQFLIFDIEKEHTYSYEIDWSKEKMENWGLDFGEKTWLEVSQCSSLKNNAYISEKGLMIKDDFVIFGNSSAEMSDFTAEFQILEGNNFSVCFDVKGFLNYKMICFENGEIHFHEKKQGAFINSEFLGGFKENRDGFLLRIERKNGLMIYGVDNTKMVVNCRNHSSNGGAFGFHVGQNTVICVKGCKLDSI